MAPARVTVHSHEIQTREWRSYSRTEEMRSEGLPTSEEIADLAVLLATYAGASRSSLRRGVTAAMPPERAADALVHLMRRAR